MIAKDLTRDIKISLKTAMGQLNYVVNQVDNLEQAENLLLQLKAVQATLTKTTVKLLDDTYRKALAEKISFAHQNCPGNCGNEDKIERLRKLFPDIDLENVTQKLKDAQEIENELQKYLAQNLDSPPSAV